MRPVTVSITGNGAQQNSAPIPVDYLIDPMNLGLFFKTNGSTTVCKVQYSLDDPFAVYATDYNTNGIWFDHATMVNMTANANGTILTPVRAVRLQASSAGVDICSLTVVQSGMV